MGVGGWKELKFQNIIMDLLLLLLVTRTVRIIKSMITLRIVMVSWVWPQWKTRQDLWHIIIIVVVDAEIGVAGGAGARCGSRRAGRLQCRLEFWPDDVSDCASVLVLYETFHSGKHTATVTRMSSGATGFEMGFVIRLNRIAFGALVAYPLLVIAVFSSEVLLNPNKIAQGVARVMVQTAGLRADKHPFLDDLILSNFSL